MGTSSSSDLDFDLDWEQLDHFAVSHPFIQAQHRCTHWVNMGSAQCVSCDQGISAAVWYSWYEEHLDDIQEVYSTNQVTYIPDLFLNPCCNEPPWRCICPHPTSFSDADDENFAAWYDPTARLEGHQCVQCIHYNQRSCPELRELVIEHVQVRNVRGDDLAYENRLIGPCTHWRSYLPPNEQFIDLDHPVLDLESGYWEP